ncbi:SRPBCC family protein [Flavobacterium silvaticum]|uniref:SRPBCC domain-containing protein n=1 Tax=Flavobacterium silvaticum TaxID=1852020 RepID=A0A972JI45_9FLAO|nr:SRPBCC domain-containing protein [Flavobacterium silvaticum]NMH27808.1 SRPBCC domain-containing protein [Flavobacterium silvaticum]
MEHKTFEISINASREKVWKTLWSDETYPKWTSAFAPGSTIETDWREGSRVLFLDVNRDGMISEIAQSREPEYLSFKHIGEMKDGKEDLDSEKVQAFQGSEENYTLTENGNGTTLKVEMDIDPEYFEFFEKTWPRALEHLKMLSEADEEDIPE